MPSSFQVYSQKTTFSNCHTDSKQNDNAIADCSNPISSCAHDRDSNPASAPPVKIKSADYDPGQRSRTKRNPPSGKADSRGAAPQGVQTLYSNRPKVTLWGRTPVPSRISNPPATSTAVAADEATLVAPVAHPTSKNSAEISPLPPAFPHSAKDWARF